MKLVALAAALAMTALSAHAVDPVKVMSYNVRYDNVGDAPNDWSARGARVAATIKVAAPDVVGTQEVLHHQWDDLRRALPEYDVVGCGRDDGRQAGEYAALWFRRDRFEAVDSGNFWLSATPEVKGSLGWDGACVRMASWALLRDRRSGKRLLALNTHLDHVGVEARRLGVELILERLSKIAPEVTAVVTGDFNSGPESAPVRYMTDTSKPYHLIDARLSADTIAGPAWTFHDFGRVPEAEREIIDYVFVTPSTHVLSYTIDDNTADAPLTESDHCPVTVVIDL